MKHYLILAVLGLLLTADPAQAESFDDSALEQIRLLHRLDPASSDAWTRYLALQEQLIQKAAGEQSSIVAEADRQFHDLPATLRQLKRRISATAEKGLSARPPTGSPSSEEQSHDLGKLSSGDVQQLESFVDQWIDEALAAGELELRLARSEIRAASSALQPLFAVATERQRKQEVIAKVVMIIADVLNELTRREEEQRKLDRNNGKADRLEPSAAYDGWGALARSAQ